MDEERFSRWDLLPVLGLLALAAYTLYVWPRLPDPLPAHWNASWRPTGWLPKTTALCFMFGLPAFVWLSIGFIASYAVSEDAWRASLQLHALAPLRGLLCAGLVILMSLTVTIPLHGPVVFWPTLGAFLLLIALGLAFMARIVQRELPPEHRHLYKGGLLYCNPEDPRLWVEKLIGIGWTLNFARPAAWGVLALLVLIPLATAVLVLWFE
ncbi:MAG TPA: DUF5808 domain-containing protein [Holophagaceae bacterium]|nr:DUF5808 domain-containing protein [Holophagaceae bacterium]